MLSILVLFAVAIIVSAPLVHPTCSRAREHTVPGTQRRRWTGPSGRCAAARRKRRTARRSSRPVEQCNVGYTLTRGREGGAGEGESVFGGVNSIVRLRLHPLCSSLAPPSPSLPASAYAGECIPVFVGEKQRAVPFTAVPNQTSFTGKCECISPRERRTHL